MKKEKMKEIIAGHARRMTDISMEALKKGEPEVFQYFSAIAANFMGLYYELFGYEAFQDDIHSEKTEEQLRYYVEHTRSLEREVLKALERKK